MQAVRSLTLAPPPRHRSSAGASIVDKPFVLADLTVTPFAEILRQLSIERRSGDLQVRSGKLVKTVFLDQGRVVFAASNVKDDRLGEALVASGRITREELHRASSVMTERHRRFGEALVQAGVLDEQEIGQSVAHQVNRIVLSLFARDGAVSFEDRTCPIPVEYMVVLAVGRLLYDGIKVMRDESLVLAGLGPLDRRVTMASVPPFPFDRGRCSREEIDILQQSRQGATLRCLVGLTGGLSFPRLRAVYSLLASGVLQDEPVAEQAKARAFPRAAVPHEPVPSTQEQPRGEEPGSELAAILSVCRPELVFGPLGDKGRYVIKDPRTAEYYHVGQQECFLLGQLDGSHNAEAVCAAFQARFGRLLSAEDLRGFLRLADHRGFLLHVDEAVPGGHDPSGTRPEEPKGMVQAPADSRLRGGGAVPLERQPPPARAEQAIPQKPSGQSLLYWRLSLFDPDRLFAWLEPKVRFLWTPWFLALTVGVILTAAPLAWANRYGLLASLPQTLHWQTLVLAWLTLGFVTACHEAAHGMTCKHYRGEVHEVGFLLMYFLPCFYCNVSDTWLFRDKSKRLAVMLAGTYCDMCLSALAVFVWRLTLPHSVINYLAWLVVTICGGRVLLNLNPLLKLDGYYMLSDLIEIPNLRGRAWSYVRSHLRWLLWGAPCPARDARGKALMAYGIVSWSFSLLFLSSTVLALLRFSKGRLGALGVAGAALLATSALRRLFTGFGSGEVKKMILLRHQRTALWILIPTGLVVALCFVQMEDRYGGPFQLRPLSRAELRAQVAGFLEEAYLDEGDRVSAGMLVARLSVPDLSSRIAQTDAAVREVEADLRRLAEKIVQYRAQVEASQSAYKRAKQLLVLQMISEEQGQQAAKDYRVNQAQLAQAEAEVQAARAHLAQLQEEARNLEERRGKSLVLSPVSGLIRTPRVKQKVGQYFKEGELIAEVEEPSLLEVEIAVAEQDVARVRPGQKVHLKVRALAFETFEAVVDRIAPSAGSTETQGPSPNSAAPSSWRHEEQGNVSIYCRVRNPLGHLRSGMTGYARIYCGRRPVSEIVVARLLRPIRTEYWW